MYEQRKTITNHQPPRLPALQWYECHFLDIGWGRQPATWVCSSPDNNGAQPTGSAIGNHFHARSGHCPTIKDADQQAVEDADVNLLVSHSAMTSMLLQNEAANTGNGQYSATFDFSQDSQGEWRVTVEVRKVQQETIRKDVVITIP
jgi:hypothetical protein